jgi:hypothetical protein
LPLAQSEGFVGCCPFLARHWPVALQVLVLAGQLSGSSALVTVVHVPLTLLAQDWHVPLHGPEQQTPWSQVVEAHSSSSEHVLPPG